MSQSSSYEQHASGSQTRPSSSTRGERQPLRPDAQPEGGFYFGLPTEQVDTCATILLALTCCCCCLVFFLIPFITFFTTRNAACDPAALKGVTPPFDGQLVPEQTTLIERYSDWNRNASQLFDVYDSTATSGSVGYLFNLGYFSWVRLGYADRSNRAWFQARFSKFFSRAKPYTEFDLMRCDEATDDAPYRLVEGYFEGSWLCFRRCRRVFHLYKRGSSGFGKEPHADAIFDSPSWRDVSDAFRVMNLTRRSDGQGLGSAAHYLGDTIVDHGLSSTNRWVVQPAAASASSEVPRWVVAFTASVDEVTGKSFAWLWCLLIGCILASYIWYWRVARPRGSVGAHPYL